LYYKLKLIIIGNGGTGKSTLADKLAKELDIPVTHLDRLTFGKNWVRLDEAEFKNKLTGILAGDNWIVEGWSYHSTVKQRIEASETVFYLAYPAWFSYMNSVKRHLQYTFKHNPYDPPDSWIWRKTIRMFKAMNIVRKIYEPELRSWLKQYEAKKEIHIFKNRKELNRFLPVYIKNNKI
jgi:adenylate kinase family enzyme